MQHHPDLNPSDPTLAAQTFKEVSEAYARLSGGVSRPRADLSYAEAERLFWEMFGPGGEVELAWRVPGRSTPRRTSKEWQAYAMLVDREADERLTSGVEARALYRAALRALRGAAPATASDVREAARAQLASHADVSDPRRIAALLVGGRESLNELVRCLGTATATDEG